MRGQFRPPSPLVPQLSGVRENQAVTEIKRVTEDTANVAILNGRLTDLAMLPTSGTVGSVFHRLGRKPVGFFLAYVEGFPPGYQVTSVDDKRISYISIDDITIHGSFTTDGAGEPTATGDDQHWTISHPFVGVYRVTFNFEALAIESAFWTADVTTATPNQQVYGSSTLGKAPTVDFHNHRGPALIDADSSVCFFAVTFSGLGTKFKLWVF